MTKKPPQSPSSELRPGQSRAELDALVRKAAEKIASDPAKAAKILTDWIATPAGAKKNSAKSASVRTKKSA